MGCVCSSCGKFGQRACLGHWVQLPIVQAALASNQLEEGLQLPESALGSAWLGVWSSHYTLGSLLFY